MLLLDALQPQGVSELLLDGNALIPALGALARVQQDAFVQLLDEGGIVSLGMCISVSGSPRPGRPALRVRITLADRGVIKQQVMGGSLWVYPLPIGVRAHLDVRVVGRGASIGGKRKVRMEVTGGTAGIIFDARGRPLPLALTPAQRAEQLPAWYAQATQSEIRPIRPEWLEPVTREPEPVEVSPAVLRAAADKPRDAKAAAAARQAEAEKLRERIRGAAALAAPAAETEGASKEDETDELRNLFS
jgi:hypothetical protein